MERKTKKSDYSRLYGFSSDQSLPGLLPVSKGNEVYGLPWFACIWSNLELTGSTPRKEKQQSTTAWLRSQSSGINIGDSLAEIKDFAYKTFDQLDQDGDGFLSQAELNNAFTDPIMGWREKSFLLFLMRRVDDIASAYSEEWAPKGNGFSRVDLQEYFDQLEVARDGNVRVAGTAWMQRPTGGINVSSTLEDIKDFALSTFDLLDQDGDGFLTKVELNNACTSDMLGWRQKSFLVFLINRIEDIEKAFHEEWAPDAKGISRMDLQEYFRKLRNG